MKQSISKSQSRLISSDIIWIFAMSVVVFIVCAWLIPQRNGIYLSTDEFSQYAIAAYFAGFDWSGVVSHMAFYQFGYPLVFLLPLFWIFGDNTVAIYHASLVINAFLAALMVPLTYYILRHWGMKNFIDNKLVVPIILFSTLQGFIVTYTLLGNAEIILVILGFILTALIIRIQAKGVSHKLASLFAFLLVYGFSVHMRLLGVLFAGVLVFFAMVFLNKLKKRYLISFSLVVIVSFFASMLVQEYLKATLWQIPDVGAIVGAVVGTGTTTDTAVGSSADIANTIANVVGRTVRQTSTFSGIIALFRTMLGHFWYVGFSTFLLAYLGMIYIIKENYLNVKQLIKNKIPANFDFATVFILLGFLATFMIGALFMMRVGGATGAGRGDHFIYGRYNNILIMPLVLYAFAPILFKNKKPGKFTLLIPLGFLLLSIFTISYFNRVLSDNAFSYVHVVNHILLDDIFLNSIVAIVGFALVFVSLYKNFKPLLSGILIIFVAFNVAAGHRLVNTVINPFVEHNISFDSLSEIEAHNPQLAYYLQGPRGGRFQVLPSQIQFALPNTKLMMVDDMSYISDDADLIFIPTGYIWRSDILNYGIDLSQSEVISNMLFAVSEPDLAMASGIRFPISMFSTQNGTVYEDRFISDGSFGLLIHGPYATIDPGSYLVTAQLELLNYNDALEWVCSAEIVVGVEPDWLLVSELLTEDFTDGRTTLEMPFSIEDRVDSFQFRIITNENAILQVSDISIQLIEVDE